MEKTVLCFGDSNTWGSNPGKHERFPRDIRWTGALQKLLGHEYYLIEEGLCGRTTVWDDPVEGIMSGKSYLLPCLITHKPVDLVVLMLGTNDLKQRYSLPPSDIARGIEILAKIILNSDTGPQGKAPKILVVAPPRLAKLTEYAEMFAGGNEKSRDLAKYYSQITDELDLSLFDANQAVVSSNIDGIHWEADQHTNFARALAKIIPGMI
jgi:lysophospholipase L1-like esterase